MIEVINKIYIQRFFARKLPLKDLLQAVTYTQFEGQCHIPFWYKKVRGETATINLKLTKEELYSHIKSNTRNEIKRAQKEGCAVEYNHDYASFVPYYNRFCQEKGLDDCIDVQTLAKYDKTLISIVKYGEDVLAMHATVVNMKDKEAMLLYSCSRRMDESVDKRLIGWGNRLLHYEELMKFKEWGIERYEWNGICTDPSKPSWYSITQFKLSFGGEAKVSIGLRTPLFVMMKWVQTMLKKISRIRHRGNRCS